MLEFFKHRKYRIKFRKTYIPSDSYGNYNEVKDSVIFETLDELKQKYKFEIVNVELKGVFGDSCITIKCSKDDKYKIFLELCMMTDGWIEKVSI